MHSKCIFLIFFQKNHSYSSPWKLMIAWEIKNSCSIAHYSKVMLKCEKKKSGYCLRFAHYWKIWMLPAIGLFFLFCIDEFWNVTFRVMQILNIAHCSQNALANPTFMITQYWRMRITNIVGHLIVILNNPALTLWLLNFWIEIALKIAYFKFIYVGELKNVFFLFGKYFFIDF